MPARTTIYINKLFLNLDAMLKLKLCVNVYIISYIYFIIISLGIEYNL